MPQLTVTAARDSFMRATQPDTNYGASGSCSLGAFYLGGDKTMLDRAIGNFDVAALAGKGINAAQLERYLNIASGAGAARHLYRCTRPSTWTEGGVTWNKYDGVNAWTAAGGDFDSATPPPIAFNEPAVSGWHILTGLKPFVEDALANRANIVSLILKADDENPSTSNQTVWNAKEAGSLIWLLRIDWSEPGRRSFGGVGGGERRPRAPSAPRTPRPAGPQRPARPAAIRRRGK